MKFKEMDDEITICIENERIDITNSQELKEKVKSLIEEGVQNINIDFSQVKMIDSSGIGKLLFIQKRLKEVEGRLCLINIENDYIKKIIRLMHLDEVIEIKE
jgi:anti-anti-sigma factor